MKNSRKTIIIPRAEYAARMRRHQAKPGSLILDGKQYRRVLADTVTTGDDLVVTSAIPGAVVAEDGLLVYYRAVPPPPPNPPSAEALDRVQCGEGTGDDLVAVAVWARHALNKR